jgi:hypothetical protein
MGLSMRGSFADGGLRKGGCFAGFSAALSVAASIPEAPRSLSSASPRSGAPASPTSTPVAASASRKSLSSAVDTPSFLCPRESICIRRRSSSLFRTISFDTRASTSLSRRSVRSSRSTSSTGPRFSLVSRAVVEAASLTPLHLSAAISGRKQIRAAS